MTQTQPPADVASDIDPLAHDPFVPDETVVALDAHLTKPRFAPELLAPAGNWDCALAAIENGADAIYFGLDCGFNARYRAQNFTLADLADLTRLLRERGVRGYATMNTLVFPSELPRLVDVICRVAEAGIDAVLVQDFGVARLVREICPELEIHASTQMSLTSAETIAVASRLGISRVVLARELSVGEVARIAKHTTMPLEVFIHGALCVAYSGQCLTSESLGGRSANRGQCAQACRLPYELVCDGVDQDLGDVKYLLSPQDLAGYAAIPALIDAGVASVKIEGRLKTPEYVANITSHYRQAIDHAMTSRASGITRDQHREMELSFSRGLSPGWLEGNDHKRLVPGRFSAKLGVELGEVTDIRPAQIQVKLAAPLALGDGLAIHTSGKEPQGGRVYTIRTTYESLKLAPEGETVWIGFGSGEINFSIIDDTSVVFKNDDPQLNRRLRQTYSNEDPRRRQRVDLHVTAIAGQPLRLDATLPSGITATVMGTEPLPVANKHPADEALLRDKLGRMGGTPLELGRLTCVIQGGPMTPAGMLNGLRRELVENLVAKLEKPTIRKIDRIAGDSLLEPISEDQVQPSQAQVTVLCRTLEQIQAIVTENKTAEGKSSQLVEMVYADFQDVRQYRDAVRIARDAKVPIALASIRIQKPGEMGLLKFLTRTEPDAVLARNLAAIDYFAQNGIPTIADFSLNVANHRSAQWIRSLGVRRVTASYDLNRDQLMDLVAMIPSEWLEVVIHQRMPMFHMEHCVFCAVLSPGTNKTNCGRPCDNHVVQLRDRVGAEHPLQADIACRNTLYNATPQSGAEVTSELQQAGIRHFRIELLTETADEAVSTIRTYQSLLAGSLSPNDVLNQLRAVNRVGVTRGTLETRRDPLAIL